uniref:Uncharacterized protein LOC114342977 n=1 Tax=Diabrotica virgifera virgifera TaxID=50390 RepID=A0A6P7GIT0_DIAVI
MNKCNSQNLRDFVSTCKQQLLSLQNLDYSSEELFESLLVYMLEQKIDFISRRGFEEEIDPDKLPSTNNFFVYLDRRCNLLEKLSNMDSNSSKTSPKPNRKVNFHSNVQQRPLQTIRPGSCIYCNDVTHKIYNCPQFRSLPHSNKIDFIKNKKLCFNCLGTQHTVENCPSSRTCSCGRKHHSLIHQNHTGDRNSQYNTPSSSRSNVNSSPHVFGGSPSAPHSQRNVNPLPASQIPPIEVHSSSSSASQPTGNSVSCHSQTQQAHVLLATTKVAVYTRYGERLLVKVLLDNGSQDSFITRSLCKRLGYATYPQQLYISGISDNDTTLSNEMLDIEFLSIHNQNIRFSLSCAVIDKITKKLPQFNINSTSLNIPPHFLTSLADPDFDTPSDIDILVGGDLYYDLLDNEPNVRLGYGLPIFLSSYLGWVIAGVIPHHALSTNKQCSLSFHVVSNPPDEVETSLEKLLIKFFETEELPCDTPLKPEESLAEEIFVSTTQIVSDGGYQVEIPFKIPKEYT